MARDVFVSRDVFASVCLISFMYLFISYDIIYVILYVILYHFCNYSRDVFVSVCASFVSVCASDLATLCVSICIDVYVL